MRSIIVYGLLFVLVFAGGLFTGYADGMDRADDEAATERIAILECQATVADQRASIAELKEREVDLTRALRVLAQECLEALEP